ncbi:hypothetical protein ACP70R_019391 [Stipagrostis hirtigluma subsp. patula]
MLVRQQSTEGETPKPPSFYRRLLASVRRSLSVAASPRLASVPRRAQLPMPSAAPEEAGAGVQMEHGGGEEGRGGTRVLAAAAEEEEGVGARPPRPPAAPSAWSPGPATTHIASGCIPCGHVYGTSCLERWLQHCGNTSAKCPQCGERFEHKHIINLYAPGNLWDGCCRIQEVKEQLVAEVLERTKSEFAEREKLMKQVLSELIESIADLQNLRQSYKMTLSSLKERMMNMVQKNVPLMDIIEILEQACTALD